MDPMNDATICSECFDMISTRDKNGIVGRGSITLEVKVGFDDFTGSSLDTTLANTDGAHRSRARQ